MISEITDSGVQRSGSATSRKYRKVTQLAKAIGWSRGYLQAMKQSGLRFPASIQDAENFLVDHPNFTTTSVYESKRYDEQALASRLNCDRGIVKQMRKDGLVFTHGSTTLLSPVLDWVEQHPKFLEMVSFSRGRWPQPKKETTLHV